MAIWKAPEASVTTLVAGEASFKVTVTPERAEPPDFTVPETDQPKAPVQRRAARARVAVGNRDFRMLLAGNIMVGSG